MAGKKSAGPLDPGYEIFIALISILSVFNLFLVWIPGVDRDAVDVVATVNFFLIFIFLFDFSFRFITAPSRTFYLIRDFGWADLLAIVPVFRFLRLFRIFKVYRLVNRHGTRNLLHYLSRHRAESALYILLFAVIVIIESGSFFVLMAESPSPNANITSSIDALWWTFVTITTVGYGDHYPVTNAGRVVGMLVMVTGVGIFATFAGFIANKLLIPATPKDNGIGGVADSVPVAIVLSELRQYLAERDRIDTEIRMRLDTIEQLVVEGSGTEKKDIPAD